MAQPKFTPGPWKLETESRSADGSDLLVTTADGAWNVADCRDHNGLAVDSVEQAEANARLIAAAPTMYAALHRAKMQIESSRSTRASVETLRLIDVAIKEADGDAL